MATGGLGEIKKFFGPGRGGEKNTVGELYTDSSPTTPPQNFLGFGESADASRMVARLGRLISIKKTVTYLPLPANRRQNCPDTPYRPTAISVSQTGPSPAYCPVSTRSTG